MLKRHRSSVVELILERLQVDSLLRFKLVSKKWRSTIESGRFQERRFIHRRQSRGPDVLCIRLIDYDDDDDGVDTDDDRRIVFGSSIVSTVRFPTLFSDFCHGSCDGLVCFYTLYQPSVNVNVNVVVNPATRWHRSFPLSSYQQLLVDNKNKGVTIFPTPELGFGKDNLTGMYKPVWLYNSSGSVLSRGPCIWMGHFIGSPSVKKPRFYLSISTPKLFKSFLKRHVLNPYDASMCILDHRLCVSMYNWPTQVIWSFDSV